MFIILNINTQYQQQDFSASGFFSSKLTWFFKGDKLSLLFSSWFMNSCFATSSKAFPTFIDVFADV